MKFCETLWASSQVIAHRTELMRKARQNEAWRALMPTPKGAQRLANQWTTISSHALAPIHAKATANARRLGTRRSFK